MKVTFRRILLLFFGSLIIISLNGCNTEERSFSSQVAYSFDTNKIFQQIKDSEKNEIFKKIDEGDVPKEEKYDILWNSDQYWQVLAAFMQEIQGEPLTDWKINEITYYANCEDIQKGYKSIGITIFKQNRSFLNVNILLKLINIEPRYGYIEYYEEYYQKTPLGLKSIDLKNKKINPENAFKIADQNGAAAIRKRINNICAVSISSQNNSKYYGWDVLITDLTFFNHVFDSIINFDTGKFKRIEIKNGGNE